MAKKWQHRTTTIILASTDSRPKSSTLTKIEQSSSVLCPPPCFSLVIRCLRNVSIRFTLPLAIQWEILGMNQSKFKWRKCSSAIGCSNNWASRLHQPTFSLRPIRCWCWMEPLEDGDNNECWKLEDFRSQCIGWNKFRNGFWLAVRIQHSYWSFWHALKPFEVSSVQATTIFDKVGLPAVLEFLSSTSAKAQVDFIVGQSENSLTTYFSLSFYVLLESFFVQIWDQAQVQEQLQPDWFNIRIPWSKLLNSQIPIQ